MAELDPIDSIISSINNLTVPEKKELSQRVRTTKDGMKAYTAVLYGIGSNIKIIDNPPNGGGINDPIIKP